MKIRKIFLWCLAIVLWLSAMPTIAVETEEETVVLRESFSGGVNGEALNMLSPWYDANAYLPTGETNNNQYTIQTEGENKLAHFYKGPAQGASRLWAARPLSVPSNAESVKVSFSVRTKSEATTLFEVGFKAAGQSWWSNGDIRLSLGATTVGILRTNGREYDSYNDKLTVGAGVWNQVSVVFEQGSAVVKVNDKSAGSFLLATAKGLNGALPSEIAFGFQRQQAVGSEVEIDDLVVSVQTAKPPLVSAPTFYINYGQEAQQKLSAFSEGDITGSIDYCSQSDSSSMVAAVALYDDSDRLVRVNFQTEAVSKKGTTGRMLCQLDTRGGASAQLFLWENRSSCRPLLGVTTLAAGGISVPTNETLQQSTKTYYVSPVGSDKNPGTKAKPFKTLAMAAETAEAGSTVLLADGVYRETRQTVVKNSGSENAPIVFKAENQLQAQVIYPASLRLKTKFLIEKGRDYIRLEGLSITQEKTATEADSTKTEDILYACYGDHCEVVGNKLYHAYEEAVKFYLAKDILIADNIITDMEHEAIDLVNCEDVVIRGNDLSEFGRIGLFGKGGTRNMVVYNNYIHNKERKADVGLGVGGSTDARWSYDVAEGSGYENYNSVYYNNVIHAETSGAFLYGLGLSAPKNAYIYNNIVLGADYGYCTASGGGVKKGWPWWPGVDSVDIKNNVFYQCGRLANETLTATNFSFTHNLLWQTDGMPKNSNNIEADPLFVDPTGDWHLKDGSPAKEAGVEWPVFSAFGGGSLTVERVDYAGVLRQGAWSMGIYN